MEWALENGEQSAHRQVIGALISMHAPEAQKAIEGLLAGGDQRLMPLAADSLSADRSQHAIPILLQLLKKLDFFGRRITEVRQAAAALGRIGADAAVPYLEKLLNRRLFASTEAKKELRRTVALALRNIGGDEALLVLQRNASCYNRQVKEACAWALSRPEHSPRKAVQDRGEAWDEDNNGEEELLP
jgi:HEAT repeat protein